MYKDDDIETKDEFNNTEKLQLGRSTCVAYVEAPNCERSRSAKLLNVGMLTWYASKKLLGDKVNEDKNWE